MNQNKEVPKIYPSYAAYDVSSEINNLEKFIQSSGMKIDSHFYSQIKLGDIIEVYSLPENTQVYSNSEFRRLSSYTPEQMKSIPYTKLFWRDNDVHLSIMKRAEQVCRDEKKMLPWGLGTHEVVEALHPRRRTFNMNMKWVVPCFSATSDDVVGVISTCQVEFLYELPE